MSNDDFQVNERILVRSFQKGPVYDGFINLKIGNWNVVEVALKLSLDEARSLADALTKAADYAEVQEEAA